MASSNDEIRGVLVQVGEERLLLPNATVAEVLSRVPVEAIDNAPAWLSGQILWHGWQVPVVSLTQLTGQGLEKVAATSKIIVLKSLSGVESLPYFALLTQSFPRLVSVPRDGLLADATEDALPPGVQMRVLLGDEAALLPDLENIGLMISEALAVAA